MKDSLNNMKYIEKNKLVELIKELKKDYILIAPVKLKNFVLFRELKENEEPYLDFLNSRNSPKEFFFPQTENIVEFEGIIDKRVPEPENIEIKKRIILGMRPCDIKSILILDKLFINEDYVDNYYKRLRDNTLIFGFGCNKPRTTCFCTSLESGPFFKEGSDGFITDIGDKFIIEGITEGGKKLIEKLENADEDMVKAKGEIEKNANDTVPSSVKVEKIPQKLREMFEHPIWEEISERCLGCGVCTYLCPTCHCFDIQDEVIDERGRRVKNWDSCMFPIFTLHGSGHQPREFRYQRMRQRIMHKFNYYEENFGVIACCGCGRCITQCPVNIDVREIIDLINNVKLAVSNAK